MVDKVKNGEPLYGNSKVSDYLQGVAARNSRYSQLFIHILPWFNAVNHDQVSHSGLLLLSWFCSCLLGFFIGIRLIDETSMELTLPSTINKLRGNLKLSAWPRLVPAKIVVLQNNVLRDLAALSDVGFCILIPPGATVIDNAKELIFKLCTFFWRNTKFVAVIHPVLDGMSKNHLGFSPSLYFGPSYFCYAIDALKFTFEFCV